MHKIKLIIIVLLSIILAGCTPLFLRDSEPKILNNATGLTDSETLLQSSLESNQEVLIKSINSNLIDGLVYDISSDGKTLLLGSPSSSISGNIESAGIYSNLHTYNIKNNQLKQVLLSSKEQVNALFDKKHKGMIYVEYNRDPDGKAIEDSYRLNWTNNEGSQTKNLSTSDESVSPKFSMVNNELVIYGNTKGQIKIVELRSISRQSIYRKTYNLTENLNIYKVDYYEDYNLAFFLALNPKTKDMDLYYANLAQTEVVPRLIHKNVTDFNISTENASVLYNAKGEKSNQLISVDMYYNNTVVYEGPISMFYFTPDENKIIYGEKIDDSSNNQNIWIMNSDGTQSTQLASNLRIAGDRIIFNSNNDSIFFSVFQLESKESNTLNYKVYNIEYSYKY
ncbi:hypothetical protein GC105_11195 [Alkalibaculum sp. M08DMB]|uniref:Uncharacterized protein n=1 Tax=Alkalibaculum sporogenes TaxID=2655001 RepID=A0A6A7KBH0_9FIRM|nr:hypothetical protein [Alkalibaculum sporogenes]MPW26353.1 hypothetical protein [Alkalibaculum sporogenes]